MIKIIHVISDTNIGGAGRWLINYSKYYDREKYDLGIILPRNSKLVPFLNQNGVKLFEIDYMADKSFDTKAVSEIDKVLKSEKPQILHTHASLSARIAGRNCKVPFIFNTRHCIEPVQTGVKGFVKKTINSYYSDYFIACAESVKRNFIEGGINEDKIRVVANGVEQVPYLTDKEKEVVRNKYGLSSSDIVVSIMARLEEVKGHKFLIESFNKIKNENIKLVIAGTGSLEDELKKLVSDMGLEDKIKFVGYVTDTALLLNITDINVISSVSEAMSLAILESMSIGIPTVATNVGGNGELIADGENGYLVSYGDSDGMAEKIEKLADESLRKEMGIRAKAKFEESYRADIAARTLEKCYEEALTNGRKQNR